MGIQFVDLRMEDMEALRGFVKQQLILPFGNDQKKQIILQLMQTMDGDVER